MRTDFKEQTVSVLVPCYNVEGTLGRCLDSIEAQTHDGIEIVAVDDGSTDGTGDILRERSASSRLPFKIIEKGNTGYGDSMNRAMDEATGDWIAIVEPDDWIESDMYESMLSFADSIMDGGNAEYAPDIIKTPYWREVGGERLHCGYKELVKPKRQPFMAQDELEIIGGHPSIWSAIYRRDYLVNHGIHFEPIPGAGWSDNPFMVSSMCRNFPIVYLDREFYHYTDTGDDDYRRIMSSNPTLPFDRWHDMMDTMEDICGIERGELKQDDIDSNNEPIFRSIVRRGFTYLALAEENKPADGSADAIIDRECEKMFARMPKRIVETDSKLSGGQKERFESVTGVKLDAPRFDKLHHIGYLVKRGIAAIGANGIGYTLGQMSKAKR